MDNYCPFAGYVSKYRIELDRDNQSELAKSADANGRTKVKELNHILREHFDVIRAMNPAIPPKPPKP